MFATEMATDRIQDLVREAEAQRLSSSVHAAHTGPEGTAVGRLTHGVVAAERFFHMARREVGPQVRKLRLARQAH